MAYSIANAVKDVAEIMEFENWLRFYFVKEEGDTLFLHVPEQAFARIQELYPHLAGLVEELNNKAIDYETSISMVCQFVVRSLDGLKYPAGLVPEVFDNTDFQDEMQLFNSWTQSHEAQLDQGFLDFNTWVELYTAWKTSSEVKDFFKTFKAKSAPMAACNSDTVQ